MTINTQTYTDNRPVAIETAAALMGVKVRYVRELVANGRIRYFKVGHLLRFRPSDLDTFLEASVVEPGHRPSPTSPEKIRQQAGEVLSAASQT